MNQISKRREISKYIKSLILGSYLGDGTLTKSQWQKQYYLKVSHSIKQKEYADWKVEKFCGFANNAYVNNREIKGRPYQTVTFITKTHPFCTQLRGCYINGNKQIKKWMMTHLDPLSLTIWYLDDGDLMWRRKKRKDGSNYKYIGGCRVALGILSDKSCKILKDALKSKFDLDINIKEDRVKGYDNVYKRAYFNMTNTRKLFEVIKDLVPNCMRYKISLQHETSQKDDDIVWTTRINEGVEEAEMTSRLDKNLS